MNPLPGKLQPNPFEELRTPVDEREFVRRLRRDYNVRALPGSYLALVAPLAECAQAARRMAQLASGL